MADTPSTAPSGRIDTLDTLRGLALLGILAVNAAFVAMPWPWVVDPALRPPQGADAAAWTVVQVLFEGKFISLFSMLFGVSLFLVGGDRTDRTASARLRRRLLWLLLFGVAHGAAIWFGDILLTYAVTGLIIAPLRAWNARRLLTVGLWVFGVLGVLGVAAAFIPDTGGQQARIFQGAAAAALAESGGYRGGFADSLQANVRDWLSLVLFAALPSLFYVGPLMLIGLGLFKAGVLSGQAPDRTYKTLIAAGAGFLALMAALTLLDLQAGHRGAWGPLAEGVNSLGAPLATLAYASLLILAVRRGVTGLQAWLAPVGRMAFTNYLAQSVIMTALFYGGRGPGLYGELGQAGLLALVVAVWAVQLAWSRWWLSRHAYGPMEWLWRSLTEGRRVRLRC